MGQLAFCRTLLLVDTHAQACRAMPESMQSIHNLLLLLLLLPAGTAAVEDARQALCLP